MLRLQCITGQLAEMVATGLLQASLSEAHYGAMWQHS
jgi:hypothetical protein